ncbi:hypothetical protein Tco_1204940 [Tanacetum coccineum]
MNPPLVSIPESTSAMLHMIMEFAMTTEYTIPHMMKNNMIKVSDDTIFRVSKQLYAIKSIQNEVAFAEMIRNDLRLNIEKKCDATGNPMASKRDRRRKWTLFCKEMKSGERNDVRRIETENGSAKRDTFVK